MRPGHLCLLLLAPVLALGACGRGEEVDTATYTCAEFNKSLRSKDDDTSGQFINRLRDEADLGQEKRVEQRELTLAIFYACRNKPGSTRPAKRAIASAKQMRAGKFKVPGDARAKKKSTK